MKVSIKTFLIFTVFVMLFLAGCSGSSSTTTTVVQGSSPVIRSLSVQGLPATPGSPVTATVVAQSAQGLALTYTWTATSPWSVSPSSVNSQTAAITAPSGYDITGTATVEVSDTHGRYALNTIPLSTVGDITPVINNITASPNPAPRGGTIIAQVTAFDVQGNKFTESWAATTGWGVTGYGTTATVIAPDTYSTGGYLTVTVSDNFGAVAASTIALGTQPDSPPVITGFSASPNPAAQGGEMAISVTATSPDGNQLYYTWQPANGWTIATGQGTSGITVTAPDLYNASGTFTVTVYDLYGGTVSLPIPVSTVGNSAPVITGFSASPNPVVQGGEMAISVTATSPGGNQLYYTWQAANGWTIATGQGTSGITVTAPDQYGVSGSFTVTVYDLYGGTVNLTIPVNTYFYSLPVITGLSISPQPVITSTTLSCDAYGPVGDPLSYLWTIGGIPMFTGSTAVWDSPGIPGNYTVSVAVSAEDGGTQMSSSTMSITGTSVWPRFQRDMGSTGQSPVDTSSTTGTLEWPYDIAGSSAGIPSPASIGADGTIYVGSSAGILYAFTPTTGALKWTYPTVSGGSFYNSAPAIGADGTIYIANSNLYALSPKGALDWSATNLGGGPPAIGADGTIYENGANGNLYALSPTNGSVKWSYPIGSISNAPAIGENGMIYISGYAFPQNGIVGFTAVTATNGYTYEFAANGELIWSSNVSSGSSVAIGADGTLYMASNSSTLYALSPTGAQKWSYTTDGPIEGSPAIGTDGTIYIGTFNLTSNDVYALNPDGSLKWAINLADRMLGSPAIGADGTIYMVGLTGTLYALRPADGSVRWSYAGGGSGGASFPVIGLDGTIYYGNANGTFFAIH